jgi:hypothetical protein
MWQSRRLGIGPFRAHIPGMKISAAILIGAALIAATIAYLFRYDLRTGGMAGIQRLDRWTGQVQDCMVRQEGKGFECQ